MDKNKANAALIAICVWLFSLLLSGFFVKLMWNYLAPTLFNNHTLSYGESIILFILVQTLVTRPQIKK